eukprot:TRINITY_DN330_c0_g1_i3.p1 TRINITY_DN330_c0_g1~~TRINITY_DN330_c0_g1_i3.p1  ORF type:complete len:222 (+),score=19.93 TRINITY_DN330_c0_g1_i3:279-944(+)
MLQIRGSSIIMISTPGSDNHLFSKLMKARRNNGKGDLYFRNHEEEMICTSCEARGVKTCCSHNQHKIPSWISLQRQEDLRGLMGDEMFEQEIGGKQLSDKQPDFNPKLVLQLESKGFESVRARKYGPPKVVIVAIDPTGGGRSKMAICSFIVGEHGDIIVRITLFLLVQIRLTQLQIIDRQLFTPENAICWFNVPCWSFTFGKQNVNFLLHNVEPLVQSIR